MKYLKQAKEAQANQKVAGATRVLTRKRKAAAMQAYMVSTGSQSLHTEDEQVSDKSLKDNNKKYELSYDPTPSTSDKEAFVSKKLDLFDEEFDRRGFIKENFTSWRISKQ